MSTPWLTQVYYCALVFAMLVPHAASADDDKIFVPFVQGLVPNVPFVMPLEEPVAGEIKFDFALRGIWYLPIEGADSVLDLDSFSFLISGDDWETLQLVEVTIDLASQKAHFSMWDFFPEIPTGNNNGPTV